MNTMVFSIDYSVNGSALFFDDVNGLEFIFFSDNKKDMEHVCCIPVDKTQPTLERVDKIAEAIDKALDEFKVDLFVLESESYAGSNKTSNFKDGYAIIRYLCRKHGVEYIEVPPVSLKLFTTGNSKAEKEDMWQAIMNDYGVDYKTVSTKKWDNLCDARALYELGKTYLECDRLPVKKGGVDTSDIKPFECLSLHKQQVIAKLRGRDDLYKEIVKKRNKQKKKGV